MVLTRGVIGALVVVDDLVCGGVSDVFATQAEEQCRRAGGSNVKGDCVVGQATTQQLPAVVLGEEFRRVLPRDAGPTRLPARHWGAIFKPSQPSDSLPESVRYAAVH